MQPSTRDAIMKGIKEEKFTYSDDGDGNYAIPFEMFRTVYDVRKAGVPAPKVRFNEQRGRTEVKDPEDFESGDSFEDPEDHQYSEDPDGQSAGIVVDREVKKYMASQKVVDYSVALKAVLQAKPKLAKAYVESTPIVRHESYSAQSADVDAEG